MSLLTKLLLPKVCKEFTHELFTEKRGFVDAFTLNKNKPMLINHLFLMYDADRFSSLLEEKLRKSDNLYSSECIMLNNKYYYVYTFTIPKSCGWLMKGCFSYTYEDCIEVLKLFNLQDEEVNKFVLRINTSLDNKRDELPEQDYVPSLFDVEIEKGLTV